MIKSVAEAVIHIYPDLQVVKDFRVVVQDDGVHEIVDWTSSHPIPTEEQIDEAWFEVQKANKRTELSACFELAVYSGFQSSATGVQHTYPSTAEAMVFFNATLNRFSFDPTFTSVPQVTFDAGIVSHTKEQFIQVFNDGHAFGLNLDEKLHNLLAKVDALVYSTDPTIQSSNESNLDAIKWS